MAGRAGRKGKGARKRSTKGRSPRRPQAAPPPTPPPAPEPAATVDSLDVFRPLAVRLLGVSDRTFTRLESEGVIAAKVAGTGGRQSVYDAAVLVGAYLAHRERQLTGSNDSPRDRRDRSQAELNELRLAKERSELLPREQVVREGQAYIKATMAKLRAIPSRLIRAGVIPTAAEAVVADLISEAQEEMARWQNHLDLLQAVEEAPAAPA